MHTETTDSVIHDIYRTACDKSGVHDVPLVLLETPIYFDVYAHADIGVATNKDTKETEIRANTKFLDQYTPDEIEFMFCHELQHIKNNHFEKQQRVKKITNGLQKASLPILGAASLLAFKANLENEIIPWACIAYIAQKKLSDAFISRHMQEQEFEADRGSVTNTGNLEAAVNTLKKLNVQEKETLSDIFFNRIFGTHPDIPRRISELQQHFGSAAGQAQREDSPAPSSSI